MEHAAEDSHYGLASEEKRPVQGDIAIKGTRDGLRLTLEPEIPFGELLNALAERLASSHGFFRGGELLVDTTRRRLRVSERTQLEALLAHYQMSIAPVAVLSAAQGAIPTADLQALTRELNTNPGLDLGVGETWLASEQAGDRLTEQVTRDMRESDDTLFLRRTVRSGQAIHHHSNVVVLGDVNPGAEIVAGKDILVWGVLRGMVHAGYPDNEGAMVCSLLLAPVQLRIAHLLSRPPEGLDVQPRPEVATIRNGQIVVEAWVNGRPPRK
ncbi:MAG TPA: septum site-determining protein MinC [Ktedonobacteraceae bacterium]